MQPHAAERRYLERQITFARPILVVLVLVDLLEAQPTPQVHRALIFVIVYLAAALVLAFLEISSRGIELRVPLAADLAALAVFLVLTPSVIAFWFPYLFVAFAAGIRWEIRSAIVLCGTVTLALLVRTMMGRPVHWPEILSWFALTFGTFAAGLGLALIGQRFRRHAGEHEFLARLTGLLKVEKGVAESLRLTLGELARTFDCEEACLALRDVELERIFVWRVRPDEIARITPENLSLARAESYLLDNLEASVCWMDLEGPGKRFGWGRKDGRRSTELPRPPASIIKERNVRSVLAAVIESEGEPVGRFLLVNGQRKFSPQDLRWLERIVRHLSPSLENLFLLRHVRARAIDAEHSRVARDLHDGILQTLLSVEIQLDVLRRKLPHAADQVAGSLATLQQTVRNETGELRRMVTDLRPLRVQSADLVDLMRGFAERFRNESGLAVDLLLDSVQLQVPDRVCRELFQIYREALNNIKKHAQATHVVVKLWQNETHVVLVVDDNGAGFSFAGRFTGDELDRLRIGPISIKERTRSVGGMLAVESNPGHGARLTVEVPLA